MTKLVSYTELCCLRVVSGISLHKIILLFWQLQLSPELQLCNCGLRDRWCKI